MKIRHFVTAVTLLGLTTPAFAGNYANEVLAIGVGARALGMGGAFVGLADDSTAVYWNPAALTRVPHVEIAAIEQGRQYSGLDLNDVGSSYIFLSGALTVPEIGSFGAAFMRYGVGDIPQTTATTNSDGSPNQIGTFSDGDFGFLVSYGRQFLPALDAGVTVKYLSGGTHGVVASGSVQGDASYTYTGVDIALLSDLGALTPSLKGLSFGLNLQDALNTGVAWKNTPTSPDDTVDLNPKLGLAYQPDWAFLKNMESKLSLAFDVDPKYSPNTLYHFGGELWFNDTIGVRGGFREFAGGLQGLETSLGASFKLYILQVDYAFINYELTPIQYLSMAVKF